MMIPKHSCRLYQSHNSKKNKKIAAGSESRCSTGMVPHSFFLTGNVFENLRGRLLSHHVHIILVNRDLLPLILRLLVSFSPPKIYNRHILQGLLTFCYFGWTGYFVAKVSLRNASYDL